MWSVGVVDAVCIYNSHLLGWPCFTSSSPAARGGGSAWFLDKVGCDRPVPLVSHGCECVHGTKFWLIRSKWKFGGLLGNVSLILKKRSHSALSFFLDLNGV